MHNDTWIWAGSSAKYGLHAQHLEYKQKDVSRISCGFGSPISHSYPHSISRSVLNVSMNLLSSHKKLISCLVAAGCWDWIRGKEQQPIFSKIQ